MVNFQSARCRQQSRATKASRRSGFTLVEVLLVLAILGAIAAMVVPDLLSRQNKAQSDSVLISIKATEQALKMYAIDHGGKWPKSDMAIKTLLEAQDSDPQWSGPYLESSPIDPWGYELRCRQSKDSGPRLKVYSVGPDGKESTDDDVFEKAVARRSGAGK
ncbi:MAG: type II secretion system protein GspG [Planctomycetota bacterium]|nr:MAG: type II secretion system protein GspG [Planctomycetota bacterium]